MDMNGRLYLTNSDGEKTFEGRSFEETGIIFDKARRDREAAERAILDLKISDVDAEHHYLIDKIYDLKMEAKHRLADDKIFRQIELFRLRKSEVEDELMRLQGQLSD